VHVLGNMVEAVRPGGAILDLQVIRPNPVIELGDRFVCDVDGESLLQQADAAVAAIDAEIGRGRLIQEAVDDHDVRTYFANGRELVEDFADKELRLPEAAIPEIRSIAEPCVRRDHCRLRRLRVVSSLAATEPSRRLISDIARDPQSGPPVRPSQCLPAARVTRSSRRSVEWQS
jgi:hypothetical protein